MYEAIYSHEGLDALWQNGVSPVRVIRQMPDATIEYNGSRARTAKIILKVRASDVALPRENDLVTIGTATYRLNEDPEADAHREIYTCPAIQVA